jgi:hypothetical protein
VYSVAYVVPGATIGCSAIKSLLLSTLQCLYWNSECFPTLINYIREMYLYNVDESFWSDVQPLVDDPLLSRFPPDTLLSTILKNLMVERWISLSFYDRFYTACAPSYCTYSERIRTATFFSLLVTLISTIGGLTVSLRLIIPMLVMFVIRLFTKTERAQQPQSKRCSTINKKLFQQ